MESLDSIRFIFELRTVFLNFQSWSNVVIEEYRRWRESHVGPIVKFYFKLAV